MDAEHVATHQESLKSHLVEPLLTTLVRRHLSEPGMLDLAVALTNKTALKVSQSMRRVRSPSLILSIAVLAAGCRQPTPAKHSSTSTFRRGLREVR